MHICYRNKVAIFANEKMSSIKKCDESRQTNKKTLNFVYKNFHA